MFYPRFRDNPHLRGIRAALGPLDVPADAMPPLRRVILLCFTNRSGSNYLASMLAGTGLLNLPLECLNADHMLHEAQRRGLTSFAATISHTVTDTATAGNFALKLGPAHLEVLGESGLLALWRDRLHCIHLERLDRLGQAISWVIAEQTGQWTSLSEARAAPAYDCARILAALENFAEGNRQFDLFFARNGITPQHLLYEDFDAAPAESVARLLTGIGLPPIRTRPERVPIRRQAGAINAEWRERFLSET